MRKKALFAVAAAGVAAAAAGAGAQEAVSALGAVPSHRSIEKFEMSVGVSAAQEPRLPSRFQEEREVFHVPVHYGALVGITGSGQDTVFWFRDGDLAIRNVVLRDTTTRAYKMSLVPSSRLEFDAREK